MQQPRPLTAAWRFRMLFSVLICDVEGGSASLVVVKRLMRRRGRQAPWLACPLIALAVCAPCSAHHHESWRPGLGARSYPEEGADLAAGNQQQSSQCSHQSRRPGGDCEKVHGGCQQARHCGAHQECSQTGKRDRGGRLAPWQAGRDWCGKCRCGECPGQAADVHETALPLLQVFEHERVSSELKKQIQQARLAKKLTQAQLAQVRAMGRAGARQLELVA